MTTPCHLCVMLDNNVDQEFGLLLSVLANNETYVFNRIELQFSVGPGFRRSLIARSTAGGQIELSPNSSMWEAAKKNKRGWKKKFSGQILVLNSYNRVFAIRLVQ